jgi:hypothetical protein
VGVTVAGHKDPSNDHWGCVKVHGKIRGR